MVPAQALGPDEAVDPAELEGRRRVLEVGAGVWQRQASERFRACMGGSPVDAGTAAPKANAAASYWIKINDMPQGGSPYTQAWGDGVSGGHLYMMQYLQRSSPTTACPRPHYGANLGGWDPSPCTVGAALNLGEAHHVIVAWDRVNGKVDVWVDGQQFTLYGKPTGTPTQTALQMWLGYDNREL